MTLPLQPCEVREVARREAEHHEAVAASFERHGREEVAREAMRKAACYRLAEAVLSAQGAR